MSDVMEKTLASVSGFLLSTVAPRNTDLSPGFCNLVRSVTRARSKSDEEKAVKKELDLLKSKLAQPDIGLKKTKEYLVRLLYCEMLGQSASFGYIYALKLAQQGTMVNKRVGYLAVSLFLHENHELVLLLINTLQRDLRSTNILDNCMALGVLCNLVSADMIPAMLPLVEEKMQHPRALVRKKAVMVLHRFYHKAPHLILHIQDKFKQALCDRDPSVMYAALQMYYDLVQQDPSEHLQLVRPLVGILDQVISRKLSADFDYHGVSAPWMQILLLKMLAKLGAVDERSCSLIHSVLDEMFNKANLSQTIAFAVQYECIMTVTSVHPTQELLEKAAFSINKFIRSKNNNLKYLGISALSAILDISPSCAIQHQATVINCLDDKDLTIRFKTVELLYRMTDKGNVSVVCKKLMAFLNTTKDDFVRRDLVNKITQLADKYRPTVKWYIDAMTMLIITGGNIVPKSTVHRVINVISKDNSPEVRQHALQLYLAFASKQNISETLLRLITWVLGDCCTIPDAPEPHQLVKILCSLLDRPYEDDSTREWVVSAIVKVIAHTKDLSDDVREMLKKHKMTLSMSLRQRIHEVEALCNDMPFMHSVLPTGQELQLDSTLSFLDDYVSDALENGAAPYKPRQQRHTDKQPSPEDVKPIFAGLNFQPYESPASIASGDSTTISSPTDRDSAHPFTPAPSISSDGKSARSSEQIDHNNSTGLKLEGVNKVWGRRGFIRSKSSPKKQTEVRGEMSTGAANTGHTEMVLPGKDSGQASVQMSDAKAVGMSSKQNISKEETEEDRQKKELARALFGGMQRSMVMSNAPIDGRKQQVLQREENNLIEQLSFSNKEQPVDGPSHTQVNHEQLIAATEQNSNKHFNSELNDLLSTTSKSKGANFDPLGEIESKTRDSRNLADTNGRQSLGDSTSTRNADSLIDSTTQNMFDTFENDLRVSLATSGSTLQSMNSIDSQKMNLILDTEKTENLTDSRNTKLPHQDNDSLLENTNNTPPESGNAYSTINKVSLLDIAPENTESQNDNLIPSDMDSHPHSKEHIELESDEVVRLMLCKVWKPDVLGLVFFVINHSQTHDIQSLVLKLDLPSNFKPSEEPVPISIDAILPGHTRCITVDVACKVPSLHMNLGGQLSYRDYTNTKRRMFFNSPITIADLLRPKVMETSEYGQLWPQLTHDHRLTFGKVNVDTMSKIMKIIEENLQLHPVDLIGNEGISSGTLLSSAPCLMHSKLTGQKLDCWIKSSSQLLSDSIAKYFSTIFR